MLVLILMPTASDIHPKSKKTGLTTCEEVLCLADKRSKIQHLDGQFRPIEIEGLGSLVCILLIVLAVYLVKIQNTHISSIVFLKP